MLVVTHAGQRDHHGTVQGQYGSTEPPALAPPALSEAVQLARQVECRETKAREGNCQRETTGVTLVGGEWQGCPGILSAILTSRATPWWQHLGNSRSCCDTLEQTSDHEAGLPGPHVLAYSILFTRSTVV